MARALSSFLLFAGLFLCLAPSSLGNEPPKGLGDLVKERLVVAAHLGDVKNANKLMDEENVPVDERDPYGWTPLMRAADSGHVEVAELLLNRGADVNAFDSIGWTATHQAAANGHKAVLDLLLENGAAAGKQDSKKQMAPIHKAAAGGYRACVASLLEAGAAIDVEDATGTTPLMMSRNVETSAVLLENGADIHHQDHYGFTPLTVAAAQAHVKLTRFLLEQGAEPNVVDGEGKTPLDWATDSTLQSRYQVQELLMEAGGKDHLEL